MDSKYKQVLINIEDLKKKEKNRKFQEWLDSTTEDNIPVKYIIEKMCNEVIKSIKDNNMKISNEKQLKNEIATFIYRRSNV
tara:strand:- start:3552 stop:3794 length:243 start_codon:yes stop_codon:yes gene_type:complete